MWDYSQRLYFDTESLSIHLHRREMWCQTGEWQVFRWLVGLQTIQTRGLTKHECVEKCFIVQQWFFETQGQCEPSNSRFNSMMDHCPFACSDGECPDPAGNDECQDDSLYCPREKYLVWNFSYCLHVHDNQCFSLWSRSWPKKVIDSLVIQ